MSNKDWKPLEKPAEVTGDADRGRQLFKSVGCLACHSNLAEFGEEWITRDLMHREGLEWLRDAALADGKLTQKVRYEDVAEMRFARQAVDDDPAPL